MEVECSEDEAESTLSSGGTGEVGLGRNLLRSFKGGVFQMTRIPAFFSQGWTRLKCVSVDL